MQHRQIAQSQTQSYPNHPESSLAKVGHPVDRHVGRQVSLLRLQSRVTQAELAAGVGISAQQLQKYEKAKNRISASMLFEIAGFFGVPVSRLFEGLGLPANEIAGIRPGYPPDEHIAFAASVEGRRLIESLLSLSPRVRHKVSSLLTSLSEELADAQRRDAGVLVGQSPECAERAL
jgi:transcriptional regulator with XRE-family HTH domain